MRVRAATRRVRVYVIEPDLRASIRADGQPASIEPHGLNPMNVLRLARSMDGRLSRVLLVGCEPETLGGEDGHMGLSGPVGAAVDDAIPVIESLVADLLRGEGLS